MGHSSGEFEKVLEKIKGGRPVSNSTLLPFLSSESKDERYRVNLALADAFHRRHARHPDGQSLLYARACIDRALLLSRYSPEVLPLLITINRALNDVAAIKLALKRVGIEQAARGNFDDALWFFDRWAYADNEFTQIDAHGYDPDIIACVERMAALHCVGPQRGRPRPSAGGKVRLAYLMQGLTQASSVLVKIDRVFARLHDKARFEVAYFTTEGESEVAASPDARAAVAGIRADGCQVFVPPDCGTVYGRLLAVGESLRDFAPDVLITCGGLATFKNYFVTCMKPAPVTVALQQGHSAQFSWHSFDHSIGWNRALLIDCPAECSHVLLEIDLPSGDNIRPAPRAGLNIPAAAIVLASGGRPPKFQDPAFWQAVDAILRENPDLYWVFIGLSEAHLPSDGGGLTTDALRRIRFLGWQPDYLKFLAAADLFVDSYPLGGGVLLAEAMSLGLPTVSFEHDYVSAFDNTHGSGGDEIVGVPDLLIPRGDFGRLSACVSELARDAGRRRELGAVCRESVRQMLGDPARMVRRCEEIYERVLREKGQPHDAEPTAVSGQFPPRGDQTLDEYRLSLIERDELLNRREAELRRRDNSYNERLLVKFGGMLRRRARLIRDR